jgi:hypothetical protein
LTEMKEFVCLRCKRTVYVSTGGFVFLSWFICYSTNWMTT